MQRIYRCFECGAPRFLDLWRRALQLATVSIALCALGAQSGKSETRALLIGIDRYEHTRPLEGAVADATDIKAALHQAGATDVVTLLDEQAHAEAIRSGLAKLTERVRPDDFVLVGFSGIGTLALAAAGETEEQRILLLSGFKPQQSGAEHCLAIDEIQAAIAKMDAMGARVLGVIDAGFGEVSVRSFDPRATAGVRIRSWPALTAAQRCGTSTERLASKKPLQQSLIIQAQSKSYDLPEISILGPDIRRGALSFAIARGLELAATTRQDASPNALADYARTLAYQLSDERQSTQVTGATRSVKQLAGPGMPTREPPPDQTAGALKRRQGALVTIATVDGRTTAFQGLAPQDNSYVVVAPQQSPSLLWDTSLREVIASGDVIAQNVTPDDIPYVVDRSVAVRDIKQMTARSPQQVTVAPNGGRHRQGQIVTVEVHDVVGRALVLFSIAGNGKVELLYPIGSDPPIISTPSYRLELIVREPYGADQIVAITAPVRMGDIEAALNRLRDWRAAGKLKDALDSYLPSQSRIGTVGIFTSR